LFERPDLAQRLQALREQQAAGPVLLLPGGGKLVDVLRRWHRRHGWDEATAHWAAVQALDVNAWLLHRMLPGSRLLQQPEQFFPWHQQALAEAGAKRWAVCAPWGWLRRGDWGRPLPELPASWEVTSDSLAAWVAGKLEAWRLVLLKSAPPPPSLQAAVEQRYVDRWLPRVVACLEGMELCALCLAESPEKQAFW